MPTQTFSSPEAHVAANASAQLRISLQLRKTHAPWRISSLDLCGLKAQWGQGGGCTVTEGSVSPGGSVLFVPTQNVETMHMNGRRFDAETIRLQRPGDELCVSSTEPHCWFTVFIPDRVFTQWSEAGVEPVPPASCFLRLAAQQADALRHTLLLLDLMFQRAPDAFESPKAMAATARKLGQLVRQVVGCLPAPTTQPGRHLLARKQIVSAAMDCIDSRDGDYLTVPDLAAAAGVSERTLRDAFQAYFGMGPVQYLRVRTLNLARRALQRSDPALTTVTDVAMQFGVWELGRFAHRYELLFGELPSDTLRRRH